MEPTQETDRGERGERNESGYALDDAGVDLMQEQVNAVQQRLLDRFEAESQISSQAHAPVREAAFRRWLGEASGMLLGDLRQARTELADFTLIPFAQGQRRLCVALRRADHAIDLVLADIPYGQLSQWQSSTAEKNTENFLGAMLEALLAVLSKASIVAIMSNKAQKWTPQHYRRLGRLQVGKRLVLFWQPE